MGRSDIFAIRPLKFSLPSHLIAKSGAQNPLPIKALDSSEDAPSVGYNEQNGISFTVDASALKSGCVYNNDINTSNLKQFANGLLNRYRGKSLQVWIAMTQALKRDIFNPRLHA